jgi:hypothetical protein
MLPASTTGGGMCQGPLDVCKVPTPVGPVPTPFVNIAQLPTALKFVPHVLVVMRPAVNQGSRIPISSGDEPGVAGGVISAMNMGPAQPRMVSSKVYFGGGKAVYHTSMWGQNGANANVPMGVQATPSQTKVIVAL